MKFPPGALARIVSHSLLALVSSGAATVARPAPTHPLDPLTKQEILDAVAVVKGHQQFGSDSRFALIQLAEPSKQEVLAYRAGSRFDRQAFIVVYDYASSTTSEAIVDVRGKRLVSWKNIAGVQPGG